MTQKAKNIKVYLWLIPFLLLSGLIIYLNSRLNSCDGLVHAFGDFFLLLILFLSLTIFLTIQLIRIFKRHENRTARISVSFLSLTLSIVALQGKFFWKEMRLGSSILSASIYPDQLDIGRIELLDNENYYALYGHIDWSCAFTDNYQMKGDTLILNGRPFEKSDGIIADKYIMTDSLLFPVVTSDRKMDRTEKMKIEKKN